MSKTKNKKQQHFEVHYLAIALVLFLLVEALLFSVAGQADWQAGVQMLDISDSVHAVVSDVAAMMQPVADTVVALNQFYDLAATQMAQLLDFSGADTFESVTFVTDGVYDFYQQASTQLTSLFDMNQIDSWPAQVAGVSISAY